MPHYVNSIARWRNDGDTEQRPFWANLPVEQWNRRMIPLDLCAPGDGPPDRFRKWARKAIVDRDEREDISYKMSEIRQLFATFNLPFLSLPVATPKETALDVFIKMNTSAAPLCTYDVVVAQVEASMGKSLHDLVADTRRACPTIAEYYSPEDLTLYAGALLQNREPTKSTYMSNDFGSRLLGNWDSYISGVKRAAIFLEEERVFDAMRLPTDVVVPVLVALWALAPEGGDAEGRARTILRKFLWRAFFSTRYEKSTNTRSLADFNEIRPLVMGSAVSRPAIFDNELHSLPQIQELISAGWPKKKDRLARAILALALKHGGLDLADGSTAGRSNLKKREYHHLFPDAHLKRLNRTDDRIYCSLNCALVTWQTNRNISDKEPERYLAERRDDNVIGAGEVAARLKSHLIPYDEMIAGDYEAFLNERARLIVEAMTRLCDGGTS